MILSTNAIYCMPLYQVNAGDKLRAFVSTQSEAEASIIP